MKGVLIIIDGLGDLSDKQLGDKTPLQIANKPNLDYLAEKSKLGLMYSMGEKVIPGTSDAILSIFGQDWREYSRGWLEALGAGIDLTRGDLALRANFATINNLKKRDIVDRRAGRNLTTKEAGVLADAINSKVKLPSKFIFKNTIQHRGVLVFKGAFSDNITNTDPAYYSRGKSEQGRFKFSSAEDDEDESSVYTANIVNEFIEQSHKILSEHPVNKARVKKGFLPANIIITRAAGTGIKKTNKFKRWACSTSVPVMKGICKSLGIVLNEYEAVELKEHDVYKGLRKNLQLEIKKAIKLMKKKKNADYFLVYFKETDAAGHDNKPFEKVAMIEQIDKDFFKPLRKMLEKRKINLVVTADHSTPCKLKSHSDDPVPVMLCDWKSKGEKFDEENCKKGELGKFDGKELLKKAGFVR